MKAVYLLLLSFLLLSIKSQAQSSSQFKNNLNRTISARFINQPLSDVLEKISKQGNFYFSYSGTIIRRDSTVSINIQNKTVRDVLDILFKGTVDYKESGNYIILRSAIHRFILEGGNIDGNSNSYEVEGYVYNQRNHEPVKNASVYEKHLLKSTLTDNDGYFKLKFKGDTKGLIITISKEDFRDTSISYLSSVTVTASAYQVAGEEDSGYSNRVERYGLARWLVSSRQRIQSLNIPSFIANSPFQTSLLPGLSSHGMLSSQIVNKGSLNVLGGYTAGVDGVEIAGIFNINKKDVKKFQAAGVMNIVGGKVVGMQAAGVFNVVLDSVTGGQFAGIANNVQQGVNGMQAAGIINRTRKDFIGGQFAGILNIAESKFKGFQAAGILNVNGSTLTGSQYAGVSNVNFGSLTGSQGAGVLNINWKSVEGTQFAGVLNIAGNQLKGVQIAGVLNFARKMRGTQVGLINVADTSSGYSIGLFNLVRKGYHKISLSSNEITEANISIKTGNDKLYTMLTGGKSFSDSSAFYAAGLGLGHDFIFNNKLSLSLETNSQFLFLSSKEVNNLQKIQSNLQFQFVKGITFFAGPAYSIYNLHNKQSESSRKKIEPSNAKSLFNGHAKGWLGWNFGVTFM